MNKVLETGGYFQYYTAGGYAGYNIEQHAIALGGVHQVSAGVAAYSSAGMLVSLDGEYDVSGTYNVGMGVAPPTGTPTPVSGGVFYNFVDKTITTQLGGSIFSDIVEVGGYVVTDMPAKMVNTYVNGRINVAFLDTSVHKPASALEEQLLASYYEKRTDEAHGQFSADDDRDRRSSDPSPSLPSGALSLQSPNIGLPSSGPVNVGLPGTFGTLLDPLDDFWNGPKNPSWPDNSDSVRIPSPKPAPPPPPSKPSPTPSKNENEKSERPEPSYRNVPRSKPEPPEPRSKPEPPQSHSDPKDVGSVDRGT
ncbi:hypothetical protein ABLO22_23400, partial [Pseudovibrio sp. SCPC19]